MPPGATVPPGTQREIVRLYVEERLSLEAVSERVFWSQSLCGYVLRLSGVPRRPPGVPHGYARGWFYEGERLERAIELYRSGWSMGEIAAEFGTSASTVLRAFDRAGVERRGISEAHTFKRRRDIATADALTPYQARLLRHLGTHGQGRTQDIARAVRLSTRSARAALMKLEKLGLVRHRVVHGRQFKWRRAALSTRDVLTATLAPSRAGKANDDTFLPIAPFSAWVRELVKREERKARMLTIDPGGIPTTEAVATRLGVPSRVIHRWLSEQRTIGLSVADRVLQRADGPRLEDLWPELDNDDGCEAA